MTPLPRPARTLRSPPTLVGVAQFPEIELGGSKEWAPRAGRRAGRRSLCPGAPDDYAMGEIRHVERHLSGERLRRGVTRERLLGKVDVLGHRRERARPTG
eukprot:3492756-Alexandrium_andersonii.AAC.1